MTDTAKQQHRSGFVAILGRPNVGKSTLMNALIGQKVAIVSPKAQTTRNRIMGVLTKPGTQIVFLDTPGIHTPRTKLGESMIKAVDSALEEVEAVLFVVDVQDLRDKDLEILQKYSALRTHKVLVVNKIDRVSKDALLQALARLAAYEMDEVIPISALTGDGVELVEKALTQVLPEGPQYFPEDYITDQPERFLMSEIVREKALHHLNEEIPHGVGVEMMAIETAHSGTVHIDATLYCEKDSHKNIIIGKQGSMIGRIGQEARVDIEKLLGAKVNLKLWVKVVPNWRNRVGDLRTLGYLEK